MTQQHEFPDGALKDAVEAVLPITRRDMDAQEVLEYLESHPQQLREALELRGVPPQFYEDTPSIVLDIDKAETPIPFLLSTGPLWELADAEAKNW